ncbi:meiosis induction protein kinase-like protein [Aulographum hederae CBS 113979]|uniref:Meiosis induction protein kinase-like protein n=1 Tax=Aulographum hederae CBS 113979 TaxID=1176131 RepID=A0A6G1GUS5_9PEZI|nr:meiosis induction protein kinase-like protein [Aulographum hederae CBS 113979]
MTMVQDAPYRGWSQGSHSPVCLEDRFEILKEIGDGSFGSVALGRVRSAGAHIARRGTLVAIKTMKKSFETFNQCLDLREVIFLRTLPPHPHLVPALDIFLDPFSKKLHIAMEYMDGNLYQLMKARDHKHLDCPSVKSILFQIISGLEHIHENSFFHRDIKPENILVSTSSPQDSGSSFRRYSSLVTPPSTPPAYTIKIADFGLAREMHSKSPYTTYVSTRWYRAPEVLLRAGEYSAPVDIWAIGAMAVEIATLKPLFPGGNEVDQVWRVCEIMGSPGNWVNKHGTRVGGGEWKDGVRLAQKLGFSFPKMAPHTMDTILQPPHWPPALCDLVTWCLMWDPKARPTSTQALKHEYFADAIDPLRPKSRMLDRKKSDIMLTAKDSTDSVPSLSSKTSSWFRKSLVQRESAPAVPQHSPSPQISSARPPPVHANTTDNLGVAITKSRSNASKRATWTNGLPSNAAPIPILPSIKPISPLSDTVHAQASVRHGEQEQAGGQKVGRQLSMQSGNHYADHHRQEAERALAGGSGLTSPTGAPKEGFFSHLRKRARRLSGRYQTPMSPTADDVEANVGCTPWAGTGRSPMSLDPAGNQGSDFAELDKALQSVRTTLEASQTGSGPSNNRHSTNSMLKRHKSVNNANDGRPIDNSSAPISSRTRRAVHKQPHSNQRYETPDEEDELLDEALSSAHKAVKRLDHRAPQQYDHSSYTSNPMQPRPPLHQTLTDPYASYLTPSPSANRNSVNFGHVASSTPLDIMKPRGGAKEDITPKWPTPPYEDNEWAAAAAASIFAAQAAYR